MDIQVNYFVLVLACILSMVVGFFWYSPMLFGNVWMKLMGYTDETMDKAKKDMAKLYVISFILSFATAFVLFHVMTLSVNFYHFQRLSTGLISAFWIWFGFIMPVQLTDVLFSKKKLKLFAINTGYQYVSLVVMAIVLSFA